MAAAAVAYTADARLHAGAAAAAAPPSVLLVATSLDGAGPLPPALVALLEEHDELPIRCAAARLTPRTDGGAPPRTTVDAVVALDLASSSNLRMEISLPSWLLRLLFRVVQPWVRKPAKAILAAQAPRSLAVGAGGGGGVAPPSRCRC